MILKKTFLKLFLILGLSALMGTSCSKDRYQFPYIPINLNISLSNLDSQIGPGEHAFLYDNEGLNGLLIARNFNDQYFVYDRTCTYEQDYSCSVENDTTSVFHLSCPCCESQYFLDPSDDIGEAYVTRGPTKYSLKKYSSFKNGGFLTIVN